jgi:hypothetical protein
MDRRAGRDAAERKGATWLDGSVFASGDLSTYLKATGGDDVGPLAVGILDEGNAGAAIRIVFDRENLRGFITAAPLEVDETVFALVTTPAVTAGDAPVVVATTGLLERTAETLLGRRGRDLLEVREKFIPVRRRDGTVSF